MVDDSIVRGTTCARLVKLLRDAGAAEVHMRISAPPFRHPCFFGTDIPERSQLLAHGRTVEEMREIIGVDSLGFLRRRARSPWAVSWAFATPVSRVIIRFPFLNRQRRICLKMRSRSPQNKGPAGTGEEYLWADFSEPSPSRTVYWIFSSVWIIIRTWAHAAAV